MSKAWKATERRVASFFGTRRNPCSGSYGYTNNGSSCSDSLHDKLFIETKHYTKMAVFSLFKRTNDLADNEEKIPVLCLHEKSKVGFLVVCRAEDLLKVAKEHAEANIKKQEANDGLE